VGLVWAGAFALAAVPAGQSIGGEPAVTNADVARFLPQLGFGAILIGGMFGAIALIDAASIVIYRTGVLPRWLAWLGFVCARGVAVRRRIPADDRAADLVDRDRRRTAPAPVD